MFEPLIIIVSKDEILSEDVTTALGSLKKLIKSPEVAQSYMERLDIAFSGYDNHPEELFEIPEVRNYVYKLDEQFPFWLYFLSKKHLGLQAILLCFLPPYLNEEAKQKIFPEKINDLLTKRWFPALNHIGNFVGMSNTENEAITKRTIHYIFNGPL